MGAEAQGLSEGPRLGPAGLAAWPDTAAVTSLEVKTGRPHLILDCSLTHLINSMMEASSSGANCGLTFDGEW